MLKTPVQFHSIQMLRQTMKIAQLLLHEHTVYVPQLHYVYHYFLNKM